ncbi:hypothetical protein BWQ96_09106 [Gracilariopsis chorda]|uniref:Uncharacterized protein n=1 Tax=Gracilariopsis chorda TaxID=448386 RepID=A0A2V3IGE4_9FLOR|nr:hypothetical protein BWQ96_10687 [Gracilariopsis chorda]PXF41176.1 hypothetical protein BWQ96_09106 [Gracilariopsis chorda]|eukprot:PXF39617.1 hypothetical protein BWQ96_10687 [Gracilariopsis chorda]
MECACDARQERDLLSTRLGELAMTEMENEALRAQVDDLSRAVHELKRQAHEQRDGMLLEMEVLKRRADMAQHVAVHYSDEDDEVEEESMQHLWLGECAVEGGLFATVH